MTGTNENFRASFSDLCQAWHALAAEFDVEPNDEASVTFDRVRLDVAFERLLDISGWSISEWNAEIAAGG